jgi:hypothetical protein
MRYIVAIIGALIIFICAGLVSGAILFFVCPASWQETYINLGLFSANIPVFIAILIASLAATNSFHATLKIYGKKKRNE